MHIIPSEKSSTLKKRPKAKHKGEKSEKVEVAQTPADEKAENLLKCVPPPPPRRSPNTSLTNNTKDSIKSDNLDEDTITQLEGSFPPPSFSPPPLPTPNPLSVNQIPTTRKKSPEPSSVRIETRESSLTPSSKSTEKRLKPKNNDFCKPQEVIKMTNDSLAIIPISLKKGINGLGFSLTTREGVTGKPEPKNAASNGPVYVKNILPGGSAISNGQLKQGDRLLKVDGVDVTSIGQTKIVGMLRDKPINSTVHITVARNNSLSSQYNTGHSSGSSLIANSNHDDSRKTSVTSSNDFHSKLLSRISNFSPSSANFAEYEISLKGYQVSKVGGSVSSQPPITLGVSITIRPTVATLDPESPEAIKTNAVYVRKLIEGGAAYKDGRLKVGDRLLAINNQSLSGLSANEALHTLKTEIAKDLAEEKPFCKLIVSKAPVNSATLGHPAKKDNSDSDKDDRGAKKKSPKPEPNKHPQTANEKDKDQGQSNPQRGGQEKGEMDAEKPKLPKRNHKNANVDEIANKKNPEDYFTQKTSAFSLANKKTTAPPEKSSDKLRPKKTITNLPKLDKNENIIQDKSLVVNDDIEVSDIIPKGIMGKNMSDKNNPEMKVSVNGISNKSLDNEILLTGWADHPSLLTEQKTSHFSARPKLSPDQSQLLAQSSEKSAQIYRCDSQGTIYSSDLTDPEPEDDNAKCSRIVKKTTEYRSKSAIDCPYENRKEYFINGLHLDEMVAIPLNSSYWNNNYSEGQDLSHGDDTLKRANVSDGEKENEVLIPNEIDGKDVNSGDVMKKVLMCSEMKEASPMQHRLSKDQSKSLQPLDCLSNISDVSKKSVLLSRMMKFVRPQYYFRKRSSSQSNEHDSPRRENRQLVGWSSVNGKSGYSRRINSANNVCNMSIASVPTGGVSHQNPPLPYRRPSSRNQIKTMSQSSDQIRSQSNRVSMLLRCCEDSPSPDVIHRKDLSQERPKSQNSMHPCSETLTNKSLDTINYSHENVTIEKLYEKLKEMKDPELIVNSSNSALFRTQVPSVQAYRHHDFLQKQKSLSPTNVPPVYSPRAPCCSSKQDEDHKHLPQNRQEMASPPPPIVGKETQKKVNFSPSANPKRVTLASPESSLSYRSSSASSDSNYPTYERRPISGYILSRELQQQIPESNYSELSFDSRTMSRASNSSTLTKSSSKRPLRVPYELQTIMTGPGSTLRVQSPNQNSQGHYILVDPVNRIPMEQTRPAKPENKPILEDAEQLYTKIKNKLINKPQPQTIQIPQFYPTFNNAFPPNMNLINNRIVKNIYVTQQQAISPQPYQMSQQPIYQNNMLSGNQLPRIASPNNLKPALVNRGEPIYAKVNKIYVIPTPP